MQSKRIKILFIIIVLLISFWGFGAGYIVSNVINKNSSSSYSSSSFSFSSIDNTELRDRNPVIKKAFYSDELLFYTKIEEKPLMISIVMNRYNDTNANIHYYFLKFHGLGIDVNKNNQFTTKDLNITPGDFISKIQITSANDLSTRQKYQIELNIDGQIVILDTDLFNTDFATKDYIEYTKLISIGMADIKYNNKTIKVNVINSRIYSNNYSKYIFFDGFSGLKYESNYLTLWDDLGNFVLIDKSDVKTNVKNYKSHTWVIYKDIASNMVKKTFTASITKLNSRTWDISIPDLNNYKISVSEIVDIKDNDYLVEGTYKTDGSNGKISGYVRTLTSD